MKKNYKKVLSIYTQTIYLFDTDFVIPERAENSLIYLETIETTEKVTRAYRVDFDPQAEQLKKMYNLI